MWGMHMYTCRCEWMFVCVCVVHVVYGVCEHVCYMCVSLGSIHVCMYMWIGVCALHVCLVLVEAERGL